MNISVPIPFLSSTNLDPRALLRMTARESRTPYVPSRPQSPSFLGHVVRKRGRLQIKLSGSGDENALRAESDGVSTGIEIAHLLIRDL